MNTAIAISSESPKVFFSHDRLVTTSQAIADYFDKQHKDVLRKIDSLDCSPEFTSANFCADVQTVEIGNGAERESRCFLITKDGFMFLVMGFTGKKAARLKEAYIAKFNHMEVQLQNRPASTHPTPPGNYRILLTMEGAKVIDSVLVPADSMLLHPDDAIELAKRAGNVLLPYQELRRMGSEQIMALCDEAAKRKAKWDQIYAI